MLRMLEAVLPIPPLSLCCGISPRSASARGAGRRGSGFLGASGPERPGRPVRVPTRCPARGRTRPEWEEAAWGPPGGGEGEGEGLRRRGCWEPGPVPGRNQAQGPRSRPSWWRAVSGGQRRETWAAFPPSVSINRSPKPADSTCSASRAPLCAGTRPARASRPWLHEDSSRCLSCGLEACATRVVCEALATGAVISGDGALGWLRSDEAMGWGHEDGGPQRKRHQSWLPPSSRSKHVSTSPVTAAWPPGEEVAGGTRRPAP